MYAMDVEVMSAMCLTTFFRILKKHYPHCRKTKLKTDYCTHCHLYHSSIAPKFWCAIREMRTMLETHYPLYFRDFDRKRDVKRAFEEHNAKRYCLLLSKYVH